MGRVEAVGVGWAEGLHLDVHRWAGWGRVWGRCGLDGGAVGAGHLTMSRSPSSPSSCPRQWHQQPSSLLGGLGGAGVCVCSKVWRGANHEKGAWGPRDFGKGAATALRGIWWQEVMGSDTGQGRAQTLVPSFIRWAALGRTVPF